VIAPETLQAVAAAAPGLETSGHALPLFTGISGHCPESTGDPEFATGIVAAARAANMA
jgi:hypothetical protein